MIALVEIFAIGLLASTLISEEMLLWTLDKRLDSLATELGHSYKPTLA